MLKLAARLARVLLPCAAVVVAPVTAAAAEPIPSPSTTASPAAQPTKKKRKKARVAGSSARAKRKHPSKAKPPRPARDGFRSAASLGFQHGYRTRRFDSPVSMLSAAWSPSRRLGPLGWETPLEYRQLDVPEANLHEFRAQGSLKVSLLQSRSFAPFAAAEITGVWRPNWPDPYQPQSNGELLATDRYSYWRRGFQIGFRSTIGAARVATTYAHSIWDYRTDPAFQPITSPNHLTPPDHDEHALRFTLSARVAEVRPRLSLELFARDYFFVFARDKLTGKTHAGPGGLPPNPLYRTRGLEPEVSTFARWGRLSLRPSAGLQVIEDEFQGYLSSIAVHPGLEARWQATESWSIQLSGEAWLRRYGAESYAQGKSHPPLTFGDRRLENTLIAQVESRHRLADAWSLVSGAKLTSRTTNFPAYEPFVFPRGARYDIDWSYRNWQLLFSVEYHPRPASEASD